MREAGATERKWSERRSGKREKKDRKRKRSEKDLGVR